MKQKRNRRGQFARDNRILRLFFGIFLMGAVYSIGLNTIWGWTRVFEVESTLADIEYHIPTWQEEVLIMIQDAGLDTELADKIIQHESWWKEENKHWNEAIYRNGKLVQPAHWDRGLWMISEYWHPEVSDECAFDWFCSTREAIRIWKNRGPSEWVAYRYVK